MWNFSEARPPQRGPHLIWSEAELADAWEQRRYAAHWLVDCCGRHLRVVFPGAAGAGRARIFWARCWPRQMACWCAATSRCTARASSWAGHRHARDPAYAQVVLHVVQVADTLALDGRGQHLPTVVLEPERGPPHVVRAPCVRAGPAVQAIVEAAGRERFRARAARFEGDLAAVEADQVVWRGVCEALGFKRNTRPFGQLADAVPWSQAALVVVDRGPVGLAGLLLGAAGLLAEATLPEAHAWRALQRKLGVRAALSAASWDRRQLRAANAPEWRCRGLAELAARWVAERRGGAAEAPAGGGQRGSSAAAEPVAAGARLALDRPRAGPGRDRQRGTAVRRGGRRGRGSAAVRTLPRRAVKSGRALHGRAARRASGALQRRLPPARLAAPVQPDLRRTDLRTARRGAAPPWRRNNRGP